jgi:hypothetical protein
MKGMEGDKRNARVITAINFLSFIHFNLLNCFIKRYKRSSVGLDRNLESNSSFFDSSSMLEGNKPLAVGALEPMFPPAYYEI